MLTFRRGGKKIRIHTTKGRIPDKATAPVYAEGVNMLEGLTKEEADTFLQEIPTLMPLYEIDVVKEAEPYQLMEEAAIVSSAGHGRLWSENWRCPNGFGLPNSRS
jgi:hypothetical protein